MAYIEDRIDCLEDRLCKFEREVDSLKSGIKLNNADIFSRLQHISDRVYGVPKTGSADKIADGDEPQVQQTTDEFVIGVRCKDCRYYMEYHELTPLCYQDGRIVEPNDFCSWGIIKDPNITSRHEVKK